MSLELLARNTATPGLQGYTSTEWWQLHRLQIETRIPFNWKANLKFCQVHKTSLNLRYHLFVNRVNVSTEPDELSSLTIFVQATRSVDWASAKVPGRRRQRHTFLVCLVLEPQVVGKPPRLPRSCPSLETAVNDCATPQKLYCKYPHNLYIVDSRRSPESPRAASNNLPAFQSPTPVLHSCYSAAQAAAAVAGRVPACSMRVDRCRKN